MACCISYGVWSGFADAQLDLSLCCAYDLNCRKRCDSAQIIHQHNFSHLFMTTDTKLYVISIKIFILTHNLPEIICLYYRGIAKIFSSDRVLHHLPLPSQFALWTISKLRR